MYIKYTNIQKYKESPENDMYHFLLLSCNENTAPKKDNGFNAETGSGFLIIEGK